MIDAFQAENIMTSELKIVMVDAKGNDERGVDVGGVYRDAISCFYFLKVPTQENARDLILEVAHKEIVQKPQYVADAWREALMMLKSNGEGLCDLCDLYQTVEPTNRKVLSMIRADPQNNSERAAVDFLKRLVRGMDEAQLKSFLRYVTGADVLCVPSISVQFSTLDGLARRPIAHTCGSVLELPSMYNTFSRIAGRVQQYSCQDEVAE